MTATNQDFTIFRGDTKTLTYTIKDANDAIVDLTGGTAKWEAARSVNSATKDIQKSTSSGIAIMAPTSGILVVTIDPADTASLGVGGYYHELEFTDASGRVSTVATGRMTLKEELI